MDMKDSLSELISLPEELKGRAVSRWSWFWVFIKRHEGKKDEGKTQTEIETKLKWKLKALILVFIVGLWYLPISQKVSVLHVENQTAAGYPDAMQTFYSISQKYSQFLGVPAVVEKEDGTILYIAVSADRVVWGFDGKTGEPLWKFRKYLNAKASGRATPLIADINGDGKDDVILFFKDEGIILIDGQTIFSLHPPKELRPSFKPKEYKAYQHFLAASNFIPDTNIPIPEIIVCMKRQFVVYQWNPTQQQKLIHRGEGKTDHPITTSPCLSDIDNDGAVEIALACADGNVYLFDYKKGIQRKILKPNAGSINVDVAFADINNDGVLDILIVTEKGALVAFDMTRDGAPLFKEDIPLEGQRPRSLFIKNGPTSLFLKSGMDILIGTDKGKWVQVTLSTKKRVIPWLSPSQWATFRGNQKRTGSVQAGKYEWVARQCERFLSFRKPFVNHSLFWKVLIALLALGFGYLVSSGNLRLFFIYDRPRFIRMARGQIG